MKYLGQNYKTDCLENDFLYPGNIKWIWKFERDRKHVHGTCEEHTVPDGLQMEKAIC